MPLYMFKCGECDHTQENLVKIDQKTSICEKCNGISNKTFSSKGKVGLRVFGGYDNGKMKIK